MKVLAETVDTKNIKWIDSRFDLSDSHAGRSMYEKEHVKGAVYWDLEQDLSDMSAQGGRHPIPSKDQLTRLIRDSGLTYDDHVVVYDQGGAPYAARAWWLLKYAGFNEVFISRLGYEELKAQGIETTNEKTEIVPSNVELLFNDAIYADRSYVKRVVSGEEPSALIDARSEERYHGWEEPIDKVPGRIPGARNFNWAHLTKDRKLVSGTDFTGLLHPQEPAVVYCGSGVTAAPLYAMLAEAGCENVRLYVGSYSDWILDEENAVELDRPEHPEAADDETKEILGRLIEEGFTGEMLMKKFEYEKSLLKKN